MTEGGGRHLEVRTGVERDEATKGYRYRRCSEVGEGADRDAKAARHTMAPRQKVRTQGHKRATECFRA
jgi:hypothetical protein